jgi:hypothetical protein
VALLGQALLQKNTTIKPNQIAEGFINVVNKQKKINQKTDNYGSE